MPSIEVTSPPLPLAALVSVRLGEDRDLHFSLDYPSTQGETTVSCGSDGQLNVTLGYQQPGFKQPILFQAVTEGLEFTGFELKRDTGSGVAPFSGTLISPNFYLLIDEYSGEHSLGDFSYTIYYTYQGEPLRHDPRIYNDGISSPGGPGRPHASPTS